ncbi:MAG: nucleotidyl transferase AbiEii/AbiGii toxin family protein [Candidatus Omnitrophica bacterium]|nr:nucleotidyl transferase AbiEii/AbiGii toxin family protein [Candidatus Omnitrophota bacterium]
MLHQGKDKFLDLIDQVRRRLGFPALLIEKDYYLTLILSRTPELSDKLVFKGGTCLNKVYFAYYRLSEDLNFSMQLPGDTVTRGIRRQCIRPVKDKIVKFAQGLGMKIDESEKPGRNESKQYVWYFTYPSLLRPVEGRIKFEIGLRFNPLQKVEKKMVRHGFLHPFTGEPLFDGGQVNCLSLQELIAEKLRAAATREPIAPRDFYDLDFILRKDVKLIDSAVLKLFQKKLAEDSADTPLANYRLNLGRDHAEIEDMRARISEELFDVLPPDERKNFKLESALQRINSVFKGVGNVLI